MPGVGSPPEGFVLAGDPPGPARFQALSELAMPPGMPTYQTYTSGSGTYQPTSSAVTWIKVRMKAGGGGAQGGSATATSGPIGTDGGNTTFENWTARGGSTGGSGVAGGFGGADGTGTVIERTPGARAQAGAVWNLTNNSSQTINGRAGAGNGGGVGGSANNGGGNAIANSGGGGGGGGPGVTGYTGVAGYCGAGGGEGEYVEFIMTVAQAIGAAWTVGQGGAGGIAATAAQTGGGAGAAGKITFEEHYTASAPVAAAIAA